MCSAQSMFYFTQLSLFLLFQFPLQRYRQKKSLLYFHLCSSHFPSFQSFFAPDKSIFVTGWILEHAWEIITPHMQNSLWFSFGRLQNYPQSFSSIFTFISVCLSGGGTHHPFSWLSALQQYLHLTFSICFSEKINNANLKAYLKKRNPQKEISPCYAPVPNLPIYWRLTEEGRKDKKK